MGWYPEHWYWKWVPGTVNPYMKHPVLGYYDSRDTAVIKQHIAWARQAGIEFFVFDWFGPAGPTKQEPYLDRNYRAIANVMNTQGFPFCLMVDEVFYPAISLPYSISDMQVYFNNPMYYKINGNPVVYTFGREGYVLPSPIITRRQGGSYQQDFLMPGFDDTPSVMSGIATGEIPYNTQPRVFPRNDGQTMLERLQRFYPSPSNDAMLLTWNDYGEQDFIEPTQEYGEQYLDITRNYLIQIGAYRQPIGDTTPPQDGAIPPQDGTILPLLTSDTKSLLLASGALLGIWLLLD